MIKKIFAQVVAHAFTLQADQVDKEEYAHRLYQHNRPVNGEQAQNGGFVLKYDAFINNAFTENRKISIQQRDDHNGDNPAKQGFPMRAQSAEQALQHIGFYWNVVVQFVFIIIRGHGQFPLAARCRCASEFHKYCGRCPSAE